MASFIKREIPKGAVIHVRKQYRANGNPRYRYNIGRKLELSQQNLTDAKSFKFKFGISMNKSDISKVESMWKSKLC